jgi:hypothetical protein
MKTPYSNLHRKTIFIFKLRLIAQIFIYKFKQLKRVRYFFSFDRNTTFDSFLAFFAARFSFKFMTGFFFASLLLFRSFDMVFLRGNVNVLLDVVLTPYTWFMTMYVL